MISRYKKGRCETGCLSFEEDPGGKLSGFPRNEYDFWRCETCMFRIIVKKGLTPCLKNDELTKLSRRKV